MKYHHNLGLTEGDLVELIDAPNNKGQKNAYIGFIGLVKFEPDTLRSGVFSLFSGSSWLVNISLKKDKFKILKKNQTGFFSINGVNYYSKGHTLHKPKICCKCGFIPEIYIKIIGFFRNKYYCDNCKTK